MYDILRVQAPILKIARDALDSSLDTKKFPFCGDEYVKPVKQGVATWHRDNPDEDQPRLILSVIGGLTHYEICCLQNLERALNCQRMVIGSNQVLTSRDFINNLVPGTYEEVVDKDAKKRKLLGQPVAESLDEEVKEEDEEAPKKKKKKKVQEDDDAIELEDIEVKKKGLKTKSSSKIKEEEISQTSKRQVIEEEDDDEEM